MNHSLSLLIILILKAGSARGLSLALYHKNSLLSPYKIEFKPEIREGSFLIDFSLGSTETNSMGVLDTGSNPVWSQCDPCEDCSETELPLFNPKNSPSYKLFSYKSSECQSLRNINIKPISGPNQECVYKTSYADDSTSQGYLATDLFTLSSTDKGSIRLKNFIFGCGNKVHGFDKMDMGIVGLGPGSFSLISQMGERIFSYCMLPPSSEAPGKLTLGEEARIKNPLLSTPFLDDKGYYHLILEAISVGDKRFLVPTETGKGNMVIDSGATVTDLKEEVFKEFKDLVTRAIPLIPEEPPKKYYHLCYKPKPPSQLQIPDVTFQFKGGSLPLPKTSLFVRVGDSICLAIDPSNDHESTLGSLQQINFNVGYDLDSKMVSFAPDVGGLCD